MPSKSKTISFTLYVSSCMSCESGRCRREHASALSVPDEPRHVYLMARHAPLMKIFESENDEFIFGLCGFVRRACSSSDGRSVAQPMLRHHLDE